MSEMKCADLLLAAGIVAALVVGLLAGMGA